MIRRILRTRKQVVNAVSAIGGGLLLLSMQASATDFISVFADEGGEDYQAITEIKLENGEIITIVYSQGGFEYLPQSDLALIDDSGIDLRSTLSALSNPQMSQFFVPGLFGFTAAGGPEVDFNQKVADASKSDATYSENRKANVNRAIAGSLTLRQTDELKVVQDFVPSHSRSHHATSHSR